MNPAPAVAGTCGGCSGPLAPGQRYCLACGERRGELPALFRPPERAPAPAPRSLTVPARRSFGAVGTVVLASGVLIGAAVGPALTPASLAATARQLVVVTTGPAGEATSTRATSASAKASSSSTLAAPTGNVRAPHRVAAAAPASAPVPVSPAAAPSPSPAPPAPPPDPAPADPPPATPEEVPTVAGTVVHVSHEGKGYVVATKEGQLIALHTAADPPALGDKLKTTVRALDNGTFKERKRTIQGHADGAKFHATVTFVDTEAAAYTASAHGVSMLIHMPPAATPPTVGVLTTVDAASQPDGTLLETAREDGDPASGDLDLEAIVRDPDPAAPDHLVVSADDAGESPATLSLLVPPELDVSKLTPGKVILATVTRADDGSLTLASASEDR